MSDSDSADKTGPPDPIDARANSANDPSAVLPELRLNVSLPGFRAYRELGYGALARQLGIPDRQLTGHWCSRCEGIWFGYLLEVECPQCGSRTG